MKALDIRDVWLQELIVRGASTNALNIYKRNTNEAFTHIAEVCNVKIDNLTLDMITRDCCIVCLGLTGAVWTVERVRLWKGLAARILSGK